MLKGAAAQRAGARRQRVHRPVDAPEAEEVTASVDAWLPQQVGADAAAPIVGGDGRGHHTLDRELGTSM
jgi:hypothetical protein